jgi:penicillin-binding protein 2
LRADEGNNPLFHRALMSQYEPGSTVKPVVGLAAIAAGVASIEDRIECTGYLFLRGKQHDSGRCWTATTVPGQVFRHHSTPWSDPHPTGFLNFREAIQRSCNIYFENMADRLGTEGLSAWMEKFGFGKYSGIGIAEKAGRLPRQYRGPVQAFATWAGGIGQVSVLATPLQVANATATIARRGVWMRPKLVRDGTNLSQWKPANASLLPANDVINLRLSNEAIAAAQRGMIDVVESEAGSGKVLRKAQVSVAAKTGTAQASHFRYWTTDADGQRVRVSPKPATFDDANPQFPWYRASNNEGKVHHAWMTGFAPKDNPKVAFAVMVEYAGTGGGLGAGPIAVELLDACVEHGYVPRTK